jgi:hypothetical protein
MSNVTPCSLVLPYQVTLCYIPNGDYLKIHSRENLIKFTRGEIV